MNPTLVFVAIIMNVTNICHSLACVAFLDLILFSVDTIMNFNLASVATIMDPSLAFVANLID